jgi:hypothetical protein
LFQSIAAAEEQLALVDSEPRSEGKAEVEESISMVQSVIIDECQEQELQRGERKVSSYTPLCYD